MSRPSSFAIRLATLTTGALIPTALLAQDSKPAPTRRTVSGRITRSPDGPTDPVRVSLWLHDSENSEAKLVGEVMATGDTFAVPLARWPWQRSKSCWFVLVGQQKDHAIDVLRLSRDDADPKAADLFLLPSRTLHGTVCDEQGRPVAGASVHPVLFGCNPRLWVPLAAPHPPWEARTDEHGRFALPCIPSATTLNVMVHHPAFAPQQAYSLSLTPTLDVQLRRGATITGRVRSASGADAVRVRVEAQGIRLSGRGHALTDDQGRYRIGSLEPDAYNVWCCSEGWTCTAVAALAVAGGATAEARDLVLVGGGFIAGRVLDDTTGAPVQPGETAAVELNGPSRPRTGAAVESSRVAADGTFRMRAAPGSNRVFLSAGEGWRVTTRVPDVEVEEGRTVTVEFRAARCYVAK